MVDPNLLMPALVAFLLMILGLALTVREFYNERGLEVDPVEHVPEVVKPSPDQVRQAK